MLDARDSGHAVITEIIYLLRVVGEQPQRFAAQEVLQQRCSIAEVTRIVGQAKRAICLVGIFSRILQQVGGRLRPEADTAALVTRHVDEQTALLVA